MDVDTNEFDSYKKEVELSLCRTMLTQLEKDSMTYEDLREMSSSILSQIDDIKEPKALLAFLEGICAKWNIFENICNLYKLKIKERTDTTQKLEQTTSQLSQVIQN